MVCVFFCHLLKAIKVSQFSTLRKVSGRKLNLVDTLDRLFSFLKVKIPSTFQDR